MSVIDCAQCRRFIHAEQVRNYGGVWLCDDCAPKPCPSCAALRAEIESLRGKVNDLDAFLAEWERLGSGIEILPKIVRMRIRELGLITEARDGE